MTTKAAAVNDELGKRQQTVEIRISSIMMTMLHLHISDETDLRFFHSRQQTIIVCWRFQSVMNSAAAQLLYWAAILQC
jgi:hypothetical protein